MGMGRGTNDSTSVDGQPITRSLKSDSWWHLLSMKNPKSSLMPIPYIVVVNILASVFLCCTSYRDWHAYLASSSTSGCIRPHHLETKRHINVHILMLSVRLSSVCSMSGPEEARNARQKMQTSGPTVVVAVCAAARHIYGKVL